MPGESPIPIEILAEILVANGVEFIVIGGQAETIFGSPRVTFDVDLCYRRTRENIQRLAEALKNIKPTLRGADPGLPFRADAPTLQAGLNFTFSTEAGDLDLLGYVEPIGDYDKLLVSAERHAIGKLELLTISLEDLIRVKQHINRSKDRESLLQLLAIKRIREENVGQ